MALSCAGPTAPRATSSSTDAGSGQARPPSASAPAAPSDPEPQRALEHVRALASDIGVREAGTPGERRAAEYIRAQLESYGYRATIESFPVEVPRDQSMVLGAGDDITAVAMVGVPDGEVTGRLVFVGVGRPEDLAQRDFRGAIALANRGQVPFRDKVVAAQRAGAIGVIVANNQPGRFRGTVAAGPPEVTIPMVGVTSDDAERLDAVVARSGEVTLRARRVGESFESYNVVGRPAQGVCTGYVGAHFDSVARAPGANDNASGTAAVLELARTQRLPGVCFVAFGSEEIGLFGSEAFVQAHGAQGVRFMVNLDMLGKLNGPELVAVTGDGASRALAERASKAASSVGVTIPPGTFPPFASSDHASFAEAGVAAVTVHSGDDPEMHSPEDDFADISVDALGAMLRASAAILRDLAGDR